MHIFSPNSTSRKFSPTFNITNISYIFVQIWWFLLKGNVRYRPSELDILFEYTCIYLWYPVVLRHRWALFCLIPCRRFRVLLINIYVKFECCISSFGQESFSRWNVVILSKFNTFRALYLVQKFTFDLKSLCLEH